jgi:hypothetical protein
MELRHLTVNQLYQDTLSKVKADLMESYIYKRRKLRQIIDICAPESTTKGTTNLNDLDVDTCLKAFKANTLDPSNSDQDLQKIKELSDLLIIEHKREY